jgi:endoglucanase
MRELLKDLIALPATCGYEQPMALYISKRLNGKVDSLTVDGIGNVIVSKKGGLPGPKLMVSAHADEVGFVVKKIEENGLIRFEKNGGHDDRVLLSEEVVINTVKGLVTGIIGTISCHMRRFDDQTLVRTHDKLYIDIGAVCKAGVLEMGVNVGDPVTWATPYKEFGQNRAMGHGFDDKAGCAILIKIFEEIDFSKVKGEVYGVFSTQEELGLRGAKVASAQIRPDVAIALDTTACSDTFEAMMDNTMCLGKGPGIKVKDNSLNASLAVRNKLCKLAQLNNIPYQLEVFLGIGTDAGEMQVTGAAPSSVISIPSRYAHCPYEVIDLTDLRQSKELLAHFIMDMSDKSAFGFI